MKSVKKKTITDVNEIKASGISSGLKKKEKRDPIFMNMEYIRCPVTKVIVVNRNLFKGEW